MPWQDWCSCRLKCCMFHSLSAFTSLNWRTNNGLRYRNLGHGRSRPGSCYCCENLS
uniref:YdeA n=2 Tax=Neisseria gonorrhoeae TaxID=485 RepID=Q5EP93_NEIGO|nr:YdeA [Neisseria gonorrhoeae]